jgi:hypothetical protein
MASQTTDRSRQRPGSGTDRRGLGGLLASLEAPPGDNSTSARCSPASASRAKPLRLDTSYAASPNSLASASSPLVQPRPRYEYASPRSTTQRRDLESDVPQLSPEQLEFVTDSLARGPYSTRLSASASPSQQLRPAPPPTPPSYAQTPGRGGRREPRRLPDGADEGPPARVLDALLDGKRTVLSVFDDADGGAARSPASNRFEDFVPSPNVYRLIPTSTAHAELLEMRGRKHIEKVCTAELLQFDASLRRTIALHVSNAMVIVGGAEHALRLSTVADEAHARARIQRSEIRELRRTNERLQRAVLESDAAAAREPLEEAADVAHVRHSLEYSSVAAYDALAAEYVAALSILRKALQLALTLVPTLAERSRWVEQYSPATFYAETYLVGYRATGDDLVAQRGHELRRLGEQLTMEGVEDRTRHELRCLEAHTFQRDVNGPLAAAEGQEAEKLRRYKTLHSSERLPWNAYTMLTSLSGFEEERARVQIAGAEAASRRQIQVEETETVRRATLLREEAKALHVLRQEAVAVTTRWQMLRLQARDDVERRAITALQRRTFFGVIEGFCGGARRILQFSDERVHREAIHEQWSRLSAAIMKEATSPAVKWSRGAPSLAKRVLCGLPC